MRYTASQANNAPEYLPDNVIAYRDACCDIAQEMRLDYDQLYEDAYNIFANNPTREGAEEAAELFVSVASEAFAEASSGVREAANRWLTESQRKKLKISKKLAAFDRHSALALADFREIFVDGAVNGTMDEVAAATQVFSNAINDALFA